MWPICTSFLSFFFFLRTVCTSFLTIPSNDICIVESSFFLKKRSLNQLPKLVNFISWRYSVHTCPFYHGQNVSPLAFRGTLARVWKWFGTTGHFGVVSMDFAACLTLSERSRCVEPALGRNWTPRLIRRHLLFNPQYIEPGMTLPVFDRSSKNRKEKMGEKGSMIFFISSSRVPSKGPSPW